MNAPVIEIRNLRKEFLLSHSGAASVKTAVLWWKRQEVQKLHVLRGIDLDIARGESVAVLGRNGAGKSTLLSLLANVYKPTQGYCEVRGRVAPLLELGAGFHPDLTGLENILFNGIVLGLTRKEIEANVERIVEFSELRAQIDSPVRTYSSGMMARLGFAIAVHVDADVLIVDEVLAVGDYDFRRKCEARIQAFREAGGTIFFVSHTAQDILNVATRCLWLQHGEIVMDGEPLSVMEAYRAGSESDLGAER